MRKKTTSTRAICAVISLTLQSESNRHRFMLRLLLALIFSVLGLFQPDAMSSVVTPLTVPKSGLHSVSDKALTTSFTPVAKVTDGGERYTIVHDYLGTPTQAYDSCGSLVWEMLLDVYGEVMESRGDRSLVPFRYQGQYEDMETGLYYNRFRYYSPEMGMYVSSDPIGLAGNNPTLYGYVQDINTWLDQFGLSVLEGTGVVFEVGIYSDLRIKSKGLDLDAHHVGQGAVMSKMVKAYDYHKAPAILVPSIGHTTKDPISGNRISTKTKGLNNAVIC